MFKGKLAKSIITGAVTAGLVLGTFTGASALYADTAEKTAGDSANKKPVLFRMMKSPVLRGDVLESLQKEGVLTSEQVKAIQDKMEAVGKQERTNMMSEQLKVLVEKGTITQEQLTNIQNYCAEKDKERQAEMDKVKAMTSEEREAYFKAKREEMQAERDKIAKMTEAERKAYFEQKKSEFKDPMTEMVEKGIITQTQADEIRKLMPMKRGDMGKGGMGMKIKHKFFDKKVEVQ